MARINTNVSSLIAQRILGQQNQSLQSSLERLSTGLRINRGKDDPAGLIASENLRAEKAAISAAIDNAERADQVINVAEGGLVEVSNLLTEVESLVDQTANDAGLSAEEKKANQLQIDSILQTIDRISNSTNFQGQKLLNGDFDYTLSTPATFSDDISDVKVNVANVPDNGKIELNAEVTQSAQTAVVALSGTGGNLDFAAGGQNTATIEIATADGVQEFTFVSGAALTSVRDAINQFSDVLGASASLSGADILNIDSTGFGDDQFVSVTVVDGDGELAIAAEPAGGGLGATSIGTTTTDRGQDIGLTINGTQANTEGLNARVATGNLDVELTINAENSFNNVAQSVLFGVTGGGAKFQISPEINLAGRVSLGLGSVSSANIGNGTDSLALLKTGANANVVDGDLQKAQDIVRGAIKEVATLRGRLGAFQKNTVGAQIRSLGVALENTASAESQIRDADFAEETSKLTRAQVLQSAAQNVLGLANSQPQSVLQLLG